MLVIVFMNCMLWKKVTSIFRSTDVGIDARFPCNLGGFPPSVYTLHNFCTQDRDLYGYRFHWMCHPEPRRCLGLGLQCVMILLVKSDAFSLEGSLLPYHCSEIRWFAASICDKGVLTQCLGVLRLSGSEKS